MRTIFLLGFLGLIFLLGLFLQAGLAVNANHIVISEVVLGNTNADDEFIELYNPTDQPINLQTAGLKLHIRNSSGSSDTNKTISWNQSTIPAHGFFLFAASASSSFASQADATYSAGLVANGAAYISYSSTKLVDVIDFIAWGSHTMPTGFESQLTSSFSSGQNIERKSNETSIETTKGNSWDSDGNDFLSTSINAQNSLSEIENWETIDTTAPAEVQNIQNTNLSSSSASFTWTNPSDTDFLQVILQLSNNAFQEVGNIQNYTFENLSPDTSYTLYFFTEDQLHNISAGNSISFSTFAEESLSIENVQNIQAAEITDTSLKLLWENPSKNLFETIFLQKNNEEVVNIGTVHEYVFENLLPHTLYTFSFFTENQGTQSSAKIFEVSTIATPDTTAPAEVQNIQNSSTFSTLTWTWENPLDSDFASVKITIDGETQTLENRNSFTVENLNPNTRKTIKIQTVDQTGNISAGTENSATTVNCSNSTSVVINEIAWPGMVSVVGEEALSYGHNYQWIELFNKGSETIDLSGFSITTDQGLEILLDEISVPAQSFSILQNNELEIFSEEIVPDLYYEDDETTRLSATTTNMKLINQCGTVVETIPSMFFGDYKTYRSMGRTSPDAPANLTSSWFYEKMNGSPKAQNVLYETNLSIAYLTPAPFHPKPNQPFTLIVDVSNLRHEKISYDQWSIHVRNTDTGELVGAGLGATLENYADFALVPIPVDGLSEGEHLLKAEVICVSQSCGRYDSLSETISVQNAPWINEVMAYPKDEENEWIELKNPLDTDMVLDNTQICSEDDCMFLQGTLSAHAILVLEQGSINIIGDFLPLKNTSEKLTWKQEEWEENENYDPEFDDPDAEFLLSTTIFDIFYYDAPQKSFSFSRDETTGEMKNSSHTTKNKENSFNTAPTPVITIQGEGKSTGNVTFSLNVTGENSFDADGDTLTFFWDFGNGKTSDKENPESVSYTQDGDYLLTLKVRDVLGTESILTKEIHVLPYTSGGGGSTSATTTNAITLAKTQEITPPIPKLSVTKNFFISKISMNDSKEDWIEIRCPDCTELKSLKDFKIFDDQVFFTFPEISVDAKNSIVIFLSEVPHATENILDLSVEKKQGLTKTDEQLMLIRPDETIEDAVCWKNSDETFSQNEVEDVQTMITKNAWTGDCLNSDVFEKKDRILIRKNEFFTQEINHTNMWFSFPNIAPRQIISTPKTAQDVEIFFQTLEIKNKNEDRFQIFCKECNTSLFGLTISQNEKEIFSFPEKIIPNNTTLTFVFGENTQNIQNDFTFFIPESGLTSTDSSLSLKDSFNNSEDFVCWTNRSGTKTHEEDISGIFSSLLEKRKGQQLWEGDCLDSSVLETGSLWKREKFDSHRNTEKDFQLFSKKELIIFEPGIELSEFLINPAGDDSIFEWIELKNSREIPVSLEHWSIKTSNGNYEFGNIVVPARGFFVLSALQSKRQMKNTNGSVELFNPKEELIESISYQESKENAVFAKNKNNTWEWSSVKTPEAENIFFPVDEKIIDSDHDGLSDDFEQELGTNPLSSDTDFDSFPDGFEIQNNMNPLEFSLESRDVFANYLAKITRMQLKIPKKETEGLILTGVSEPFAEIKLFVHSEPRLFITKADAEGKWQYEVTELEEGEHKVQIQTMLNNILSPLTDPIFFSLKKAIDPEKVIVEKNKTKKTSTKKLKANTEKKMAWYLFPNSFQSFSFRIINDPISVGKTDFLPVQNTEKNMLLYLIISSAVCAFFGFCILFFRRKKGVL